MHANVIITITQTPGKKYYPEMSNTSKKTGTSGEQSSDAIKTNTTSDLHGPSKHSDGQLNDSKPLWQKPSDVLQLAKQTNDVATKLLNGEIDIETARGYSAIIRSTAQFLSIEVAKARLNKQTGIDLTL